jgi:hypothetical protein
MTSQLNEEGLIRMQHLQQPHALASLYAFPSSKFLLIPSNAIPVYLCNILGAPFPYPLPERCLCGQQVDPAGQHLQLCPHRAPQFAHDGQINHVILPCAREGNAHVSTAHSLLHLHEDDNKVPDARIDNTVIDFEQVNPLAPSYVHNHTPILTYAANAKTAKHAAAAASAHYRFVPFVVSRLGSFCNEAFSYFSSLINRIPPDSFIQPNWSARNTSAYWFQRFSVSLARNNSTETILLAHRCLRRHGGSG